MTAPRAFRYFDLVMVAFVTVLVCSNLIGPAKIAQIDAPLFGVLTFGAGVLFFPISYVFGDVLTEVYGYARSRRVIWTGFAALAFASLMAWVIVQLPPAPFWNNQPAYEIAFGSTWRIALASLIAFVCGEFVNSFVLAKMKILTEGRWLWTRTIGSTIFGEGVDSLLFYPLAFYGTGIVRDEDGKFTLCVPGENIGAVSAEILAAGPVADITIEDVPLEEIIAELFQST